MAKNYTVVSGDTLTRIAKQHGLGDWRVIYNHPSNAAFKAKRPNPDKIFPGDVLVIPDAPGTAPPAPSPAPLRSRGFFVTEDVLPGESVGSVLSRFGLDLASQITAVRDEHNAHLRKGKAGSSADDMVSLVRLLAAPVDTATTVIVPIDVHLIIRKFEAVINVTDGLRPENTADRGKPPVPGEVSNRTCTHGVHIIVTRNLFAGSGLNWIQTVRQRNSPFGEPPEFVDGGHQNQPFMTQLAPGEAPPQEFDDTPCGPIAPREGAGLDFTAMTTLAVLVRKHIVLADGFVWRFVIHPSNTLPGGVTATHPREATDGDFVNQLGILRTGKTNIKNDSAGPHLDYVLRPEPGTVLT